MKQLRVYSIPIYDLLREGVFRTIEGAVPSVEKLTVRSQSGKLYSFYNRVYLSQRTGLPLEVVADVLGGLSNIGWICLEESPTEERIVLGVYEDSFYGVKQILFAECMLYKLLRMLYNQASKQSLSNLSGFSISELEGLIARFIIEHSKVIVGGKGKVFDILPSKGRTGIPEGVEARRKLELTEKLAALAALERKGNASLEKSIQKPSIKKKDRKTINQIKEPLQPL